MDLGNRDLATKPGDDFNRYVNGHWLDSYELKDYESSFGAFNALRDRSEAQVKAIIGELQKRGDLAAGSDARKVRDYYARRSVIQASGATTPASSFCPAI